jgi:hypothetical protein
MQQALKEKPVLQTKTPIYGCTFTGNSGSVLVFFVAGDRPVKYIDPDGRAAETVWDIASLVTGVASLVVNIKKGEVGSAIVDGVGIIADAAAVVVPFVPGGAGIAIKAARAASVVADIASAGEGVATIIDGVNNSDTGSVVSGVGTVVSTGLSRGASKAFDRAGDYASATKFSDIANVLSAGTTAVDTAVVVNDAIRINNPKPQPSTPPPSSQQQERIPSVVVSQ